MLETIIQYLWANPFLVILGTVTLVEITPIKIDPWKSLFKWIGNVVNSEDRKNITAVREELHDLKIDFEENKAQEKRWHILDFVNASRHGRRHTREEWNHVISELAEYEAYTRRKGIPNGVIEEDAKYLRALFQECNMNNNFL